MDALDVIARVRAACAAGDGVDPMDEATFLALKQHGVNGAEVALDEHGFALVREEELTLAVSPQARGQGVGGGLLERLAGVLGHSAWSHGDHPAAAALAFRHGWSRTRELWVMRRPAALPLPPVDVPEGVEVRAFTDADLDAVLSVNAAAFATHPEQGALDHAGFAARAAEPWFDPAGLLIAEGEGGAVLAFHWTKQHSSELGEVYVVGVAPQAQGRGLGRLVTLAGLRHLAERGVAEVLLYVESDNTAARALYDGLGFTHAHSDTHVQYRREVAADAVR